MVVHLLAFAFYYSGILEAFITIHTYVMPRNYTAFSRELVIDEMGNMLHIGIASGPRFAYRLQQILLADGLFKGW